MRSLRFDFLIEDKGYLLHRNDSGNGRAWLREGTPDTPVRLTQRDEPNAGYGGTDPQLDYPEVWDDWSGGAGWAYRDPEHRNTYNWSENFDARVPRQLVHCQLPQTLREYAGNNFAHSTALYLLERAEEIADSTFLTRTGAVGEGKIIILGRDGWAMGYPTASNIYIDRICGQSTNGFFNVLGTNNNLHPSTTYGSYFWYPYNDGAVNKIFYGIQANGSLLRVEFPAFRLKVAGNQLWRAHGPDIDHATYLQNCGNPAGVATVTNWGATYNIGDYQAPIKDLAALGDQIFAGTTVGLYAGDQTGTFVNVLSELSHQVHPDNCRDLAIFQGSVVAQHIAGIFSYRPSNGQVEDLKIPSGDKSPVGGTVRALRGYGRWLYAGRYTGSWSWLMAGTRNDRNEMIWHTLQRFPHNAKVGRLFIDGMATATGGGMIPNRFWASTEQSIEVNGTAPIYVWPIPTLDGNPLSETPGFVANYCGSARIDFGESDWGAPGTLKLYRSLEVVTENLQAGVPDNLWLKIYYSIDGGNRTLLGTVNYSPKQTLFFPSSGDSWVTGQSIKISIESYTRYAFASPIIKSVILRGSLLPNYIETVTAQVKLSDDMLDRQSTPMRPARVMRNELRAFASRAAPINVTDPLGDTFLAKLIGEPAEQEEWMSVGDVTVPELVATIRMSILTFTSSNVATRLYRL